MGAGFKSEGYDRGQRAYVLRQTLKGAKLFRLALEGSTESPIVNPCFVVKNWAGDATVELGIEGTERKVGRDFRQGIVRDTDGKPMMVIWLKLESTQPTKISVKAVAR
jgi:hypothetical protein